MQVAEEVDEHEKAAFFEFIEEKKYSYHVYTNYNRRTNHEQALISMSR